MGGTLKTIREKWEAMERGETLWYTDGCIAWKDLDHEEGPYVIQIPQGRTYRLDAMWHTPCIIKPKKKMRLMTREEIIVFCFDNEPIIEVVYTDKWGDWKIFEFKGNLELYYWRYKNDPSKKYKFEVEVVASSAS
jgi:hypothetical protein